MVPWFSQPRVLDFLGMSMKTDLSISVGIWPVSYNTFLKRLHNTSTPSSCKAISILTTTSSGPAAFPVLQCCNAHGTSSFNMEGSDSCEAVLSSSSSSSYLSSWNKEAMYSSQHFAISSGSHKIRPLDGRMPLDTGRGPFLAISRIFLNISLMLMSLNLSVSWHFSSNYCSLAHLHCFWISLSILLYFSWSDLNCLLLCKRLLISSVT